MFEHAKYGRYQKCVDFGNYYLFQNLLFINDNTFITECFYQNISQDFYFSIDNNNL